MFAIVFFPRCECDDDYDARGEWQSDDDPRNSVQLPKLFKVRVESVRMRFAITVTLPVLALLLLDPVQPAAQTTAPPLQAPAAVPVAPREPMTVMTFNIRYGTAKDGENEWSARRDVLFDVIRNANPDLLGLQEALDFQIDEIMAAVPGYAVVGVGRDDGAEKGEYSAILFRRDRFHVAEAGTFWFSDTPSVVASKSWGNPITGSAPGLASSIAMAAAFTTSTCTSIINRSRRVSAALYCCAGGSIPGRCRIR